MTEEELQKIESLARRAVACKHWHWRIGMAALAANDLARLFTPEGDLPIQDEDGVRLISPTYSEARYQFCEHDGVRRAHEKAYVAMITGSAATDNEDDTSRCWSVGFTHLVNLLPDFHDTVTAKGLLQVVRAAFQAVARDKYPTISPQRLESRWVIDLPNGKVISADTELEALVAALEAAP